MKQEIRKRLVQSNSEQELKKWFDPLSISLKDNDIEIYLPHKFFADWFNDKYFTLLERVIHEIFYNNINIKCIINNNKNSKKNFIDFKKGNINKYPYGKNFTFNSFLKNKKNYFTFITAKNIANSEEIKYNPFIIYGKYSTGKTHLLKSIANDIYANKKYSNIFFGDLEKLNYYYNYKVNFIDIRKYFSSFDVFIIDDLQNIEKFIYLQNEILVLFDYFYENKKQMIFTCTDSVLDLDFLDSKLKSRFEWGLMVSLDPPDLDIRTKFVKNQCKAKQVNLSKEQIFTLSKSIKDIRLLQGVFHKLEALESLGNYHIEDRLFTQVMESLEGPQQVTLDWNSILDTVCEHFSLSRHDIISSKRHQKIALARQVAIFLCRDLLGFSYPKLGEIFGGRDHSTVLYACKKINKNRKDNEELNQMIQELKRKCRSKGS